MTPIEEWIICPECGGRSWIVFNIGEFYKEHTELDCGHEVPPIGEVKTIFTSWGDDTPYDTWDECEKALEKE